MLRQQTTTNTTTSTILIKQNFNTMLNAFVFIVTSLHVWCNFSITGDHLFAFLASLSIVWHGALIAQGFVMLHVSDNYIRSGISHGSKRIVFVYKMKVYVVIESLHVCIILLIEKLKMQEQRTYEQNVLRTF